MQCERDVCQYKHDVLHDWPAHGHAAQHYCAAARAAACARADRLLRLEQLLDPPDQISLGAHEARVAVVQKRLELLRRKHAQLQELTCERSGAAHANNGCDESKEGLGGAWLSAGY
eukprot:5509848-Pleurochrysis_carterae.AAC.1